MIRVLHTLPDMLLGGGHLVVLNHIAHSDRSRSEHVVCAMRSRGDLHRRFRDAGAKVVDLDAGGALSLIDAIRKTTRLARDADIVHTNNTSIDRLVGQLAAKRSRTPCVNTMHWALPARRGTGAGSIRERLRDRFAKRLARPCVRRMIAVSGIVRASWLPWAQSIGLSEDTVSTIYPGIDLSRFEVPDDEIGRARADLALPDTACVLINVARFHPGKGQADLVAMMERVVQDRPETLLLLVGDGSERSRVEHAVREAGLTDHIWFLGQRDDVPTLLRLADLFVFSSHSESFGLVIAEAMAAALPVAAYALPPFNEIAARDQTAELVDTKDPELLADAVLRVLGDPDRAREMGRAGRARVEEQFEMSRSVRALEDIYERVAAEGY